MIAFIEGVFAGIGVVTVGGFALAVIINRLFPSPPRPKDY